MKAYLLTHKLPPCSKSLGHITDCWITPSGREYAHIQYADGDEEDVSITKVRKGEREGRTDGRMEGVEGVCYCKTVHITAKCSVLRT
jgi:hypothetical protein